MCHDLCLLCVLGKNKECVQCIFYIPVPKYQCIFYIPVPKYISLSRCNSRSLSLRPWHQQARMRIAAHAERVCGTEESGWPQTLCCLQKYALRIVVCDRVCRHAHETHTATHTKHTHETHARNTHTKHTHETRTRNTHTYNAHTRTLVHILCLTYSFPRSIIKLVNLYLF